MPALLRRAVVITVALISFAVRAVAADAPAAKRPNILFIYADDQSYKTLGSYGAGPDWIKTPHVDRLAQRGVRFERSYLGAWCMPSRASLLTGKYSQRFGFYENQDAAVGLPKSEQTLAELLAAQL